MTSTYIANRTSVTTLDRLVVEGEAIFFESLVYPELNHAYLYLNESFNKEYWSRVEPQLEHVVTAEFVDEIVIGGSNRIPMGYGYSEGYKMIRAYLKKHPDMSLREWTAIKP